MMCSMMGVSNGVYKLHDESYHSLENNVKAASPLTEDFFHQDGFR